MIWPPQAILVSHWLIFKFFSSETEWPNESKLDGNQKQGLPMAAMFVNGSGQN
jgi:hypothetical protein